MRSLSENLPDIAQFETVFGKPRAHGQQSHDRYTLEYRTGLDLAVCWREFVAELEAIGTSNWHKELAKSFRHPTPSHRTNRHPDLGTAS